MNISLRNLLTFTVNVSEWEVPGYYLDNWNHFDKKYVAMILDQGDKALDELRENSNKTTDRAYQVFNISLTLFTASFAYLFGSFDVKDVLKSASIFAAIGSGISMLILGRLFFAQSSYVKGTAPSKLLDEDFLRPFSNPKDALKWLMLNECRDYDFRVKYNRAVNELRAKYVDIAVYCLFVIPIGLLISAILFGLNISLF